MPEYIWIPLLVIGIIILIIIFGSIYIVLKIIKPNRKSLLESSIIEEENLPKIMDFYKRFKTDEYVINTRDGIKLQAYYFKNILDTDKYIVMSHGHTYTHHGCVKYARMMMDKGFNIVTYDQRYHGASEGKYTTLGYLEKDDLLEVINDIFQRFGDNIYLGTYGESMGAATVLLEAQKDDRVKFVFSDCAFESLDVLIGEILKKHKIFPLWLFKPISNLIFKLFVGVKYNGISPILAIESLNIPMFFAHGEDDDFIDKHHTINLFESYSGPKEIFIAGNGARHAGSYVKDTKKYHDAVNGFVDKYLNN